MKIRTKRQLNSAAKAANRAINKGWKDLHAAQDEFAKQFCPFKVGDMFSVREYGRTRYFRVAHISGALRLGRLVWLVTGRCCTKTGLPRYGEFRFSSMTHAEKRISHALRKVTA